MMRKAGAISVLAIAAVVAWAAAADADSDQTVHLIRLPAGARGGQGYRLTYQVPLPIDVFWRFKTHFDNTFLEENVQILDHRLISRQDNVVITEDRYSSAPRESFRWETTIFPQQYRLEFRLIDTGKNKHKFHYGAIQLEPDGDNTRVIQTAYFDFWGASLWAFYPWGGGMRSFLVSNAEWERQTAVRLRGHYVEPSAE